MARTVNERARNTIRVLCVAVVITLGPRACSTDGRAQGMTNPALNEQAVRAACTTKGWTKAYRPSPQWTSARKRELLREAGLPNDAAKDYELDHRVPLCAGGSPTDPANLWLQPWPDALRKDKVEAALCRDVCEGRMSLQEAQRRMVAWQP